MSNVFEFPELDYCSVARSIIVRTFHIPADSITLTQREQSILVEFLRSQDSPFLFPEFEKSN